MEEMVHQLMKIAIAGCGTMGKLYAEAIARMENVELGGFFARPSESAFETVIRFGTKLYTVYEELLAVSDIEVVCITLPTFLHRPYAVQAAERGKHVICEKPIALDLFDAEAMMQASETYGTKLMIAHVLRFYPEYQNMKNHVMEGSIGKIGVGHAKRASLHPTAGSWFSDETLSGGVLFDLMIHDMDFMRWTLGEVRSVYAKLQKAPGIEYANATLRFENDAIVNLEAHWGYPGPFLTEVELAGQSGILRCSNRSARSMIIQNKANQGLATEGVYIPTSPMLKDPYLLELEHFFRCIRINVEPIVNATDACHALEISLAAARSVRTGLPEKIIHRGGANSG
jgi:UDP-N-acetylglucosamine 3-dehydrogenase